MARNRSRGTLVDYLVAAIEPALIMIMVGSLMFFLLDMWYAGEFLERLRWILFWFVLGIVLITRVSMQIGTSLAKAYGLALGGSVALVASTLIGISAVLAGDPGHRLVGDAQADVRLHAARRRPGRRRRPACRRAGSIRRLWPTRARRPRSTTRRRWTLRSCLSIPGGRSGKRDDDEARRPNAPGVWLIYFTLASLPLFGLGQWLVPAVEEDRRVGLFLYFLAYISSGMGLLLATSFLNLRRYLRQRKLKMPAAMTATWLSTGAVVIVGLTVAGGGLPLPGTGWSVGAGPPRESSDLAPRGTRCSRMAA